MTERDDSIILERNETEDLVRNYGKRVLLMGALHREGSLIVSKDCFLEASSLLSNETGNHGNWAEKAPVSGLLSGSAGELIDRVGEARRRKIAALTEALRGASTETEAWQHWRELEHLMFGI